MFKGLGIWGGLGGLHVAGCRLALRARFKLPSLGFVPFGGLGFAYITRRYKYYPQKDL